MSPGAICGAPQQEAWEWGETAGFICTTPSQLYLLSPGQQTEAETEMQIS